MTHKLSLKNHYSLKSYTLIAFLMTLSLFTSKAQAMDPSDTIFKHPVVQRMVNDVTSDHNKALKKGFKTLDTKTNYYMEDGHQIGEKLHPVGSQTIVSEECLLCVFLKDKMLQHISPLIQENEILKKENEELRKQLSRVEKTEAPETQGKDSE